MATGKPEPRLLVIVGPTASGKSELALKVAKEHKGEIIAADSRTLYRGMDIGTAKPSKQDQNDVPHWGLDLAEPGQPYSAKRYQDYARAKIRDIQARGRLPILVGGTGLYIDAVVFSFGFRPSPDLKEHQRLEMMITQQLQSLTKKLGYQMPVNSQNRRYLMRNIERRGQIGTRQSSILPGTVVIGLLPSDDFLKDKIHERVGKMFVGGLVEETKLLVNSFGREAIAKTGGISYKAVLEFIDGSLTDQELKEIIQTREWQYARRQKTWFKRSEHIKWFDNIRAAQQSINSSLNT